MPTMAANWIGRGGHAHVAREGTARVDHRHKILRVEHLKRDQQIIGRIKAGIPGSEL